MFNWKNVLSEFSEMFEKISLYKYLWKQNIFISIDACDEYESYDWLHIMQFSMLVSIIKIKVVIIKSDDNTSMANDNFYNCDCNNGLHCSVLFCTAYYMVKIMIISARTICYLSNPILMDIGEVLQIKSSLWNLFTNFASRNTK